MAQTKLEIAIVGDSKDAQRAFRDVSKSMDKFAKESDKSSTRFTRSLGSMGKAARLAGPGIALGLGGAAAFASKNFAEGQKVMAQTEAVIKSTGGAAKVTAKQVNTLAGSLARQTGQSDEAIQTGQNLLLTFKGVRNEQGEGNKIFDRSTRIMADLSQAMGQDTKTSAIQLGKALNDPVSGLTSLQRVGITFTDAQKEQIKALTEGGDKLAAQKVILRELESQFGGSAKAYGGTFAGSVDKAKNAVGDLSEKLGAALAPSLTSAANWTSKFLNEMEDGTGTGGRFVATIGDIAGGFGEAKDSITQFARENRKSIDAFVSDLGSIANAFRDVFDGYVLPVIKRLAPAVKQTFGGMIGGIRAGVQIISGILTLDFGKAWDGVKDLFSSSLKTAAGQLRGATAPFREAASRVGGAISSPFVTAFRAMKDGIRSAAVFMLRRLGDIADGITGFLDAASDIPLIGGKFKGPRDAVKGFGDDVDRAADKLDGLNRRKVKIKIESNAIQTAIDRAGNLKDALQFPGVKLTPLPQGDGPGRSPGKASGSLMGARSSLAPFARVGLNNGLRVSDGKRAPGTRTSSGGVSYHSSGEAIDLAGPPMAMYKTFRQLKSRYGGSLAELIYTPGGAGIKNGRSHTYTGAVAAQHYDHVHVAFDTGPPGVGDGYGVGSLKGLAKSVGLSDSEATIAAAVAKAESGGNPDAHNPNGEDSRGLWQINVAPNANPRFASWDLFNPRQNARAMKSISKGGSNWRPWTMFTNGTYKQYMKTASSLKGTFKSGGSTGGGGGGGGSSAPRNTNLPGSPSQRAYATGIAEANLLDAQGAEVMANQLRDRTEIQRLAAIDAALKKKLTEATRQRLMEEKTQILEERKARRERIEQAKEEVEQRREDERKRREEEAEAARAKYVQDVGSRAGSLVTLAGMTDGLADDVAAQTAAVNAATLAFNEAVRLFGHGTAEADSAYVAQQQAIAQLTDTIRSSRYEAVRAQLEGADFAEIAAAINTPDAKTDDIAAKRAKLAAAEAGYQQAVQHGDRDQIREFASLVLALRDEVKTMTSEIGKSLETMNQLLKQQRDAAIRAERLAQSESGTLGRALADFLGGQIGGRAVMAGAAGGGGMSPMGARY